MILKKNYLLSFFLILSCFIIITDASAQQKKDELTIALTGKYPPFSFYSTTGEVIGFDVDVSKAIAKKLDKKLSIVATEWDGILAGLLAEKYDAIIGSMAITAERAKKVDFSTPYYISGAQIFINKSDKKNIKNINDLSNKRVGVTLGETFEHFLRKHHPEITVVTYKGSIDIFQDMQNKRLDAFVTDRLVGMYQIKSAGMPFMPTGPLLYQEKMGIPVTKGNSALLQAINKSLKELRNNGQLDAIHQKWFGGSVSKGNNTKMTTTTIITMLLRGFAMTIGVAFFSLLFGIILAVPAGVILNSHATLLYHIVRSITDFIRGTPVLIQLFFIYFGAPQIGIDLSPITSAIITLSINSSAYMSEVVRSGLMSVDPGQKVAAKALGFTNMQTFLFITWPQAFRIAMPPLVNSTVALLKDTALISVISVGEVIREAQSIISVTYNPMKYYFIVAVMFFLFTYPLMKLATQIEKKIKKKGFQS